MALGIAGAAVMAGCVRLDVAGDDSGLRLLGLEDPGAAAAATRRRAQPLVPALLIQPAASQALADTLSIAYTRREHEFAFYQLASWVERPVRRVPRLLQLRIEQAGLAGAVGQLGDPMSADWLLVLGVDALYHDVSTLPGTGRVTLSAALFDRAARRREARRRFDATAPVPAPGAWAAAGAMSSALSRCFDALVPWLDAELARALGTAGERPG
ncbi:MAG: membrane integrity-associated transporter subunit PqiC [Rubrivivax sp.]|nr:membrane integrity-associated transporter subunit PqiC [Rubrivivax sp.]